MGVVRIFAWGYAILRIHPVRFLALLLFVIRINVSPLRKHTAIDITTLSFPIGLK